MSKRNIIARKIKSYITKSIAYYKKAQVGDSPILGNKELSDFDVGTPVEEIINRRTGYFSTFSHFPFPPYTIERPTKTTEEAKALYLANRAFVADYTYRDILFRELIKLSGGANKDIIDSILEKLNINTPAQMLRYINYRSKEIEYHYAYNMFALLDYVYKKFGDINIPVTWPPGRFPENYKKFVEADPFLKLQPPNSFNYYDVIAYAAVRKIMWEKSLLDRSRDDVSINLKFVRDLFEDYTKTLGELERIYKAIYHGLAKEDEPYLRERVIKLHQRLNDLHEHALKIGVQPIDVEGRVIEYFQDLWRGR
jgi:hypothetical protein